MNLVVPDDSQTQPIAVVPHELEPAGQPALGNSNGHASITSGQTSSSGQHAGSGHGGNGNGQRASDAPAGPRTPRHSADRPSDDSGWFSRQTMADVQAQEPVHADYAAEPHSGGLPVRVRQASLAPQLREPHETGGGAVPFDAPPASADAVRSTLSALQRGWERGRTAPDGPPADTDTGAIPADEHWQG
jgi:hypothetical protein